MKQGAIHREPDMKRMRNDLFGVSVTDDETRVTISEVFRNYGIVLEPHGAVAWRGIIEYFASEKIAVQSESSLHLSGNCSSCKISGRIEANNQN